MSELTTDHWLLTAALVSAFLPAAAGCQRPAPPGPLRAGHVDLDQLVRLHPAWPERDSLTALIASAHESHQRPIPPFRVPPEPSLPAVAVEQQADEAAERKRMEQVIQSRVDRDLAAMREKLEREVARFRETELATAEREARLEAEASEPAFHQHYQAVAARYASLLAPLELQKVGLQPRFTDLLLLSPARRAQRAQELQKVEDRITALEKTRDAELLALQAAYQAELRASRERRIAAAEARVANYERERLAQLQATRQQQQAEIRADLERSLRLQVALPEIRPPQPGPTAEAARRLAAATSASAVATMDRYHEAARDVEHQLYVQRQELEQLIADATRTTVLQLAQTHRIVVSFGPRVVGPDLTPRFAAWLREQRATSS